MGYYDIFALSVQKVVNHIIKTEKEIREEIEAIKRTINNYREAVKQGEFPKERMRFVLLENQSMISALKWVLGENDRYD